MHAVKQVALAIGNQDFESKILALVSHPMHAVSVCIRAREATELLARVYVGQVDVVVIDDHLLGSSSAFIDQLLASDVKVIHIFALTPNSNPGVANVSGAELDEATGQRQFLDALRGKETETDAASIVSGRLTAVAGFGGGVGRSSLVRELSWQVSQTQRSSLIVDADTYQPSLHQLLGVSRPKTIIEVARAFERGQVRAHELVNPTSYGSNLIGGLPKSSRWIELRQATLQKVWHWAKANWDHTLVDLGPILETNDPVEYASRILQRSTFPVTACAHATDFVVCLRPDPVSVTRFIRGFLEANEYFADRPVSIVTTGQLTRRDSKELNRAISKFTKLPTAIELEFLPDYALRAQVAAAPIGKLIPGFGSVLLPIIDPQNFSQPSIKARLAKVTNRAA